MSLRQRQVCPSSPHPGPTSAQLTIADMPITSPSSYSCRNEDYSVSATCDEAASHTSPSAQGALTASLSTLSDTLSALSASTSHQSSVFSVIELSELSTATTMDIVSDLSPDTLKTTLESTHSDPGPPDVVLNTTIAALAVLPRCPSSSDHTDFCAPRLMDRRACIIFRNVMDAIAGLCVRSDGEVHALALRVTPAGYSLLHASHHSTDHGLSAELYSSATKNHIQSLWSSLACGFGQGDTRNDFIVSVYHWCWDALSARIEKHADTVLDHLRKICDRSFTLAEIKKHRHPGDFGIPVTASAFHILDTFHTNLSTLRKKLASGTPTERDQFLRTHKDLNSLWTAWFTPSRDIRHDDVREILDAIRA